MEMEEEKRETESCKFFVKRPKRVVATRRRRKSDSSSDESSEDETTVVTKEKKSRSNPLVQATSSFSTLKNKAKEAQDELVHVSYKSKRNKEREGPADLNATAIVETETEKERDAQTIFERAQKINSELKGKEDDRVYRGLNNYTQYITKKDTPQGNASSGMVRKGPVRAPENSEYIKRSLKLF